MINLDFSTKKARENYESKNVPFLPAGIHENVTLKDIVIEKLTGGKYYIRFVYENDMGQTMQHTEFEPSKAPYHTDETFQESVYNQINRITNNQLIPYFGYKNGVLLSEEEQDGVIPEYTGSSFFGLINWLKETIEDVTKDVKLRVKIVYGGTKGFTQLPKYSKYTSIEPMSALKTRIVKLNIDNFEPIEVDKESEISAHHDAPKNNTGNKMPF